MKFPKKIITSETKLQTTKPRIKSCSQKQTKKMIGSSPSHLGCLWLQWLRMVIRIVISQCDHEKNGNVNGNKSMWSWKWGKTTSTEFPCPFCVISSWLILYFQKP